MIKDLASVMGFKNESGSLTIDKQHKKHLAKIKEVKTKEELKAVLKKKKYTNKNLLERLLTSEDDRNDSLSVYDNTKENDLTPSHFEFKQVLKLLTAMKEEDLDSISKNNIDSVINRNHTNRVKYTSNFLKNNNIYVPDDLINIFILCIYLETYFSEFQKINTDISPISSDDLLIECYNICKLKKIYPLVQEYLYDEIKDIDNKKKYDKYKVFEKYIK